jgi:general secretion pathway protein C
MTTSRSLDQWIAPFEERIQPLLQRLSAVPAHYWQKIVLTLIGAWIAIILIFFIMLFLPNNSLSKNKNTSVSNDNKNAVASINIDAMVKAHLFGENNVAASIATVIAPANNDDGSKDAGKTRLPIELIGLMYASDQKQARSILLINNVQKQYLVNDTLPVGGNVKLHKVLVDRVIISNNGNLEALWLFDPDRPRMAQPVSNNLSNPPPEMPAMNAPETPAEESNQNGPLAQSAVQIVPAWGNNGKLQGYRINRGANSAAFDALGFSDGDIVMKINDVSMDNPQNAIQLYQQMQRGGRASFEVMRDGQLVRFETALSANNLFSPDQTSSEPEDTESSNNETPDSDGTE